MTDLVVHIGLPKCGSTSIQKYFAHYPGYLGRGAVDADANEFCSALLRASHANRLGGWSHKRLARWCGAAERRAHSLGGTDRPLVLSSEVLGKPDRLGYVRLLEWLSALQRQWVAGRLRVIVTLRAQGQKIASEYAQRSARRFNASQADFERYLAHRVQAPDLDYGALARGLVDIVGQPNAHLSCLEEIATTTFWDDIAGFCGLAGASEIMPPSVATNRKSTGEQTWRLRDPAEEMAAKDWVNTLLTWVWPSSILPRLRAPARRSLLPIYSATRGLVKRFEMCREESITLTDLQKAAVADAFKDSNASLAETIERDLVALGYTSNDPARND